MVDILNPPGSYIKWRCAIHEWEHNPSNTKEDFDQIKKKFYKEFPDSQTEVRNFCNAIIEARYELNLPVEKFEIREDDGKKHGRVVSGMIYDIEYWLERGVIKQRKTYMANQGVFGIRNEVKEYKPTRDRKVEASGEIEEEVPF
jgi:hypothetical protein